MSSVFLQIGQCGNQLGQQLWDTYLKEQCASTEKLAKHAYIHPDGKLRCVLVDTEPKVVSIQLASSQNSFIRPENVITGKTGRGANWALGYHGPRGSDNAILRTTMNALRREVERCDSFLGVISLLSLSGGTGSGLGSHLCETIRDDYPLQYQLSCVVAPHESGESPLQHYNSLLSSASLLRHSDAICLFRNDELLRLAGDRASQKRSVSLSAMNQQLVSALWGLLLPASSCTSPRERRYFQYPKWHWPGTLGIVPHSLPNAKLEDLHSTSYTEKYVSLGNVCVARGEDISDLADCREQMASRLRAASHCVSWNPRPIELWSGRHQGAHRSVTVASNSTLAADVLSRVLSRAAPMWEARAFVHGYLKYGCTEDDVREAFYAVQTVVDDYKESVI